MTLRTAQDDDAADDTATVSHAVSGADEYAGIAVASVNVSVTDDDQPEPVNNAPVAEAGADQRARTGSTVSLDGVGSSDPDGEPFDLRLDSGGRNHGGAERRRRRQPDLHRTGP